MNQMKEEKENLILKFFGYFVGPIQFVMGKCSLCPAAGQLGNIVVVPRRAPGMPSVIPG
jgi:hypothetical protein